MVKIPNKYLIGGVMTVLIAMFSLGVYLGIKKGQHAVSDVIVTLHDSIRYYSYRLDTTLKYASEKDQLVLSQEQAIEAELLAKRELTALHFKTVNEVTKLKAQVAILLDSVAHNGDIVIVRPCESDTLAIEFPAIRLPFNFGDTTKYYTIGGNFNAEGNMSLDLFVPVSVDLYTGLDKKTKQYKATVTTDNPKVQITGINSMKFDLPRKKRLGIGASIGYGMTNTGLSPYAGIGLNYNLITF